MSFFSFVHMDDLLLCKLTQLIKLKELHKQFYFHEACMVHLATSRLVMYFIHGIPAYVCILLTSPCEWLIFPCIFPMTNPAEYFRVDLHVSQIRILHLGLWYSLSLYGGIAHGVGSEGKWAPVSCSQYVGRISKLFMLYIHK